MYAKPNLNSHEIDYSEDLANPDRKKLEPAKPQSFQGSFRRTRGERHTSPACFHQPNHSQHKREEAGTPCLRPQDSMSTCVSASASATGVRLVRRRETGAAGKPRLIDQRAEYCFGFVSIIFISGPLPSPARKTTHSRTGYWIQRVERERVRLYTTRTRSPVGNF